MRKWIFPGFSDPLLIIRDPVVIAIYGLALRQGSYPRNVSLTILYWIAALSLAFSILFGKAPLVVNLYGLRTNFLHVPLIFLIAEVMDEDDVWRFGRALLILSVPITVLMALQFLAPSDSVLNAATFLEASQLTSGLGRIRPSGPFSFTNGVAEFWPIATVFLVLGWHNRKCPLILLVPSTISFLIAMAICGSRGAIIAVSIVLLIYTAMSLKPQHWLRFAASCVALTIIAWMTSGLPLIGDGIAAMTARFEEAAGSEGGQRGLLLRIWDDFSYPFNSPPLFGQGLGLGTNVGSRLATGEVTYLIAEGEWGRILGESGVIAGLAFLLWRLVLTVRLFREGLLAMRIRGPLPLLLFTACGQGMLQAQWGRPTTLGFVVFGSGLCLAATRGGPAACAILPEPSSSNVGPPTGIRGRSVYAENLHGT